MRDIVLSLVMVVLLLKALRKPEYGAYTWAWLSLMNPHKLTYGFAYSMPWAHATAIITLLCLPFSKSRRPLPINGGVVALLLLWAWMTVTSVVSLNAFDLVWERWIFVSKIYLMLLATLMLVRGRQQIDTLLWVVVVSIGYFGLKGGIFTVVTGGSHRVWGPPGSMVEENNALAVALIVVLPLMYYLRHTASNRWVRLGLLVSMVFVGASILGSQSRGALLGLLAMMFVLCFKSKQPVRFSLAALVLIGVGIAFMPDSWTQRMDTIQNYSTENSALSRLYTWHTLWNVGLDRPLVGAGFRADNLALFNRYAPQDAIYASVQGRFWVAHSIYFQALGEHGFVGLVLYLSLWVWTWIAAGRTANLAERMPGLQAWVPLLMRMCQVSTIGFCAGGAFLSLMNLDLPFYILAFVTLCQCAVKEQQQPAARTQPAVPSQGVNPMQAGGPGLT